jgi:hypothetical protein
LIPIHIVQLSNISLMKNSVILVFIYSAADQSSEKKQPVIARVNIAPAGYPFSIPLGYPYAPAADYQHLFYVPRFEPQYFIQFASNAFPFSFLNTRAISHAAPHAVSRYNHQATPNVTGLFNTHHLDPYVAHHDRPFVDEVEIMFMLFVN